MWLKGFIVAALTASLTVGPFAGRVAKADPTSLTPEEEAIQGILNMDQLQLGQEIFAAARAGMESADTLTRACEACSMDAWALAMGDLWQEVFGKPWSGGDLYLTGSASVVDTGTTTLSDIAGDTITAVLIENVKQWDLSDKSDIELHVSDGVAELGMIAERATRVQLLATSATGSALIDALEIQMPTTAGAGYFYVVLGTSIDGTPPESLDTAAMSWRCRWNIAGMLLAAAACGWGLGSGNVALAYVGCCAGIGAYYNAVVRCGYLNAPPGGFVEGLMDFVDVVCTLIY